MNRIEEMREALISIVKNLKFNMDVDEETTIRITGRANILIVSDNGLIVVESPVFDEETHFDNVADAIEYIKPILARGAVKGLNNEEE